jgi:hypothetical protein
MSSIRWSALFLSLAAPLACAPHYDVGDAEGSAAAGSGGDGIGGSSMTGGTGGSGSDSGGSSGTNGSGGKNTTGGSGGSGEVGGSNAGGTDATGGTAGSPVAGAAGVGGAMMPTPTPPCGGPAEFEYESLATPEVVWERISRFLFGDLRNPPSELPEETTPAWAVEILREALALSRFSSMTSDTALLPFVRKFFDAKPAGAIDDQPYAHWAWVITGPGNRLGALFEGDQESNPPFGIFGTVADQFEGLSARGAFLSSRLVCAAVDPSPEGTGQPVVVGPNQTRRQALAEAILSPACAGCHALTDPWAFPLEVLAPGTLEYRTTENGLPIDTSGVTNSGIVYSDLTSLGEQLSVSCEVASCLTDQLFLEAVPGDDLGVGSYAQRHNALYRFAAPYSPEAEQFQFQVLLEAIVSSPAFLE